MNELAVTSTSSFLMRVVQRLAVAVLILASLTCVAVSWAKYKTPAQKKAADHCVEVYQDAVLKCLQDHPYLTGADCSKMEETIYQDCMQKAGLARGDATPPKFNPKAKPRDDGRTVRGASPSPTPIKPHRVTGTSLEPVTTDNSSQKTNLRRSVSDAAVKAATPSPTPSPKPKPTASKKPSR